MHKYGSPIRGYDAIVFTGNGMMGREVGSIRTCDVVMFARGYSGSLGEFALAYDQGKVEWHAQRYRRRGDSIGELLKIVSKKTETVICYDADRLACQTSLSAFTKSESSRFTSTS